MLSLLILLHITKQHSTLFYTYKRGKKNMRYFFKLAISILSYYSITILINQLLVFNVVSTMNNFCLDMGRKGGDVILF